MYRFSAAIVGSGFMGTTHLEALRRLGVRVAGIACSSAQKAEAEAQALGLPKAYQDYDELIADKSVDVVHICVPNNLHFDMVKKALEAGKHVMCEKPLALNSDETAALVTAARTSGVAAAVCYNLRYYALNFEARELVASGKIGRLFHINGCYIQDWLQFETDFNWRVDSAKGGALRVVADIGTHWMDMVQMISGRKIQKVFADLATVHPTRQNPKDQSTVTVDTEDCANILFRMDDGLMGSFTVSQVASGRKNTIRYEISGDQGAVAWNSEAPDELWVGHRDRPNQTIVKDPGGLSPSAARHASYPGGHAEGYPDTFKHCFRDFYDYLEAGDMAALPPFPTFSDGHRELQLCEAILKSHQQSSWVDVG
ncbi:Gfo/Idh/MocA family protein [Kordiimonas lacus]|uniref:Predicted dehydrogenase n=1 Tax=Kordiimonas lacus TaxID=637679 RepID=A0A1G6SWH0_9PROT|nr:Gfo/Idh/MocA family oxidoreductase [Kordiimonas lacus]SDD21113.1 Predicted dehydrogenase [Kordiimonas lacus]